MFEVNPAAAKAGRILGRAVISARLVPSPLIAVCDGAVRNVGREPPGVLVTLGCTLIWFCVSRWIPRVPRYRWHGIEVFRLLKLWWRRKDEDVVEDHVVSHSEAGSD